MVTFRQVDPQ